MSKRSLVSLCVEKPFRWVVSTGIGLVEQLFEAAILGILWGVVSCWVADSKNRAYLYRIVGLVVKAWRGFSELAHMT